MYAVCYFRNSERSCSSTIIYQQMASKVGSDSMVVDQVTFRILARLNFESKLTVWIAIGDGFDADMGWRRWAFDFERTPQWRNHELLAGRGIAASTAFVASDSGQISRSRTKRYFISPAYSIANMSGHLLEALPTKMIQSDDQNHFIMISTWTTNEVSQSTLLVIFCAVFFFSNTGRCLSSMNH